VIIVVSFGCGIGDLKNAMTIYETGDGVKAADHLMQGLVETMNSQAEPVSLAEETLGQLPPAKNQSVSEKFSSMLALR
jgi:hypothetical protein